MENHVELFVGSEITTLAVKDVLEQNHIEFIERNDVNSAIAAGFGTADKATHIFVEQDVYEKAKKILSETGLLKDE